MKHFLLTAAAAAMVLALGSCAKTEVTDVPDSRYIGFDNAYIGNPTKLIEEISSTNIDHFLVSGGYDGTQVFDKKRVAPNSNGVWTYSPLEEWVENQTYKFYAYAPESIEGTSSYDYTNGISFDGFVVNGSKNQLDFVYAASGDVSSGSEGSVRPKVQFTFGHMLSMIQFTIKSGFPEDVTLTISDIKFYGMNSKNTLTNGTWGGTATDLITDGSGNEITLTGGTARATTGTATDYTNNCVVLPQNITGLEVRAKFNVTATGGSISTPGGVSKDITAVIPNITWQQGYRYNYIVTIDGQTLDFITFDTPVVNQWTDQNINMKNDENNAGQIIGE